MWFIDKVVTHNFGILKGTQETYLGDKSIIGIRAEYAGDPTRSNRGGKTTYIEAIRYALDGSTRAPKEIQMIHHGEKAMWVELHLKDEDSDATRMIRRGRDHKNAGVLNIDWIEKTADAQAEINEFLGIDKDLDLTNFFKQSDIHGFMELGPADKGALLTKWITKGHWKAKELKAIEDRDAVKAKLRDNDAVHKALEAVMEVTEPLEDELLVCVSALNSEQADHAKLSRERATRFAAYGINKKAKQDAQQAIENLEEKHDDLLESKKIHDSRVQAHQTLHDWLSDHPESYAPYKSTRLTAMRTEYAELQADIKSRTEIQKKLKELGSTLCPVLRESCDRLQVRPEDARAAEKAIVELKSKGADIQKRIDDEEDIKSGCELYAAKRIELDSHALLIKENRVQADIKAVLHDIAEHKKALDTDLKPAADAIRDIDSSLKIMADRIADKNKEIGQLEHRIKVSQDALSKIDTVAARSAELRAELEDLNYVVFMFGRNGIPANEIENAFGEVQDNINYILDGMACGFNINFSPDRELDKWEPVCHCGFAFPKGYRKESCAECETPRQKQRKSEISIEVTEAGETQDFSLDSGGGKTLVSYAVRIGITMLKRDQNKNKLSVLFLDEVDSALDPYFVEQITGSITKVLTKKLGFRQILMVSHKSKIRDAVPDILQVTRHEDGYSTVDWL